MVAALHDDDGRVLVPGFYDAVIALTDAERQSIASLPFDQAAWLRSTGASAPAGERGYSTLERFWARPTLDCCGIWGGFPGGRSEDGFARTSGSESELPARTQSGTRRHREKVAATLERLAPSGVRVRVSVLHGGSPYLAPTDHPVYAMAQTRLHRAFGKPAVFMREGGSIPFVRTICGGDGQAMPPHGLWPARRECARPERVARPRELSTWNLERRLPVCRDRGHGAFARRRGGEIRVKSAPINGQERQSCQARSAAPADRKTIRAPADGRSPRVVYPMGALGALALGAGVWEQFGSTLFDTGIEPASIRSADSGRGRADGCSCAWLGNERGAGPAGRGCRACHRKARVAADAVACDAASELAPGGRSRLGQGRSGE